VPAVDGAFAPVPVAGDGVAWGGVVTPAACLPEAGDALEELGAELLLPFAVSPAACLHRSDSESLCSLRQAMIRPPPGRTVAQPATPEQILRIQECLRAELDAGALGIGIFRSLL
jgi:hypothetical protein